MNAKSFVFRQPGCLPINRIGLQGVEETLSSGNRLQVSPDTGWCEPSLRTKLSFVFDKYDMKVNDPEGFTLGTVVAVHIARSVGRHIAWPTGGECPCTTRKDLDAVFEEVDCWDGDAGAAVEALMSKKGLAMLNRSPYGVFVVCAYQSMTTQGTVTPEELLESLGKVAYAIGVPLQAVAVIGQSELYPIGFPMGGALQTLDFSPWAWELGNAQSDVAGVPIFSTTTQRSKPGCLDPNGAVALEITVKSDAAMLALSIPAKLVIHWDLTFAFAEFAIEDICKPHYCETFYGFPSTFAFNDVQYFNECGDELTVVDFGSEGCVNPRDPALQKIIAAAVFCALQKHGLSDAWTAAGFRTAGIDLATVAAAIEVKVLGATVMRRRAALTPQMAVSYE